MGQFISWLEDNLPDPQTTKGNAGEARGPQPKSVSSTLALYRVVENPIHD